MDENNELNIPPAPPPFEPEIVQTNDDITGGPKIVQTNEGVKDGQNKCPSCGATDISLNMNTGLLRCNYCRHEFAPEKITGMESDISKLTGTVIGSGATDIIPGTDEVMTFKCSSCGAEVVIDTSEATQARCHWCRNTLSINQQIPNGAVPDVVLPFSIKREEAKTFIEKFVGKRKFFAHPQFKLEFSSDNVMGVYLPYMVVDINAHSNLIGQGEHEVRRYTVGSGKNKETRYDADLYNVEREFDIIVEGLTVESSADKLDNKAKNKTNNIINSIMPFDTENCSKWNANYLRGYSSEKRDVNVEHLQGKVNTQAKDIARFSANETLKHYDRGVAWTKEELQVKGEQWKAAYLPVWLYSYHQKKKNMLHYVAVNARTKETMGSVPIHTPKLLGVSAIVEVIGIILWILIRPFFNADDGDGDFSWISLTAGFVYYGIMYARYRNKGARHHHEKETKSTTDNMRKVDDFVKRRTGLSNAKIKGANNTSVRGSTF
ncbi:MAG: hypothetical protein LBC84_00060 [Prevotellaceae bacterium]|jgi:DNA-directed RNA polymerase subunit RPC12/RpoP|nr:hypothetical protein [Prevotellaceae bacterium]